MENYEKKYKEAMERMKLCVRSGLKITPEYIFTELAESEDEKIRKELIRGFNTIKIWNGIMGSDIVAWLEKQAPTWSEEDEKFFKTALWHISYSISNGKSTDIHCDTTEWFKSLKGRVQPWQEWSKEDEQHIDSLLKRLEGLCSNKFERTRFAISEDREWLKSLKNRRIKL